MLEQRQCECGKVFLTARIGVMTCRECRRAERRQNAAERRLFREFHAVGTFSTEQWWAQVEIQHSLCFWCDTTLRDAAGMFRGTHDHLTPLSRGGHDEAGNIVAVCWPCNRKKGNRTEGEYRLYLEKKTAEFSTFAGVTASTTIQKLTGNTDSQPLTISTLPAPLQEQFRTLLAEKRMEPMPPSKKDIEARRQLLKQQAASIGRLFLVRVGQMSFNFEEVIRIEAAPLVFLGMDLDRKAVRSVRAGETAKNA